jgi:hypothetical protein
VKKLVNPGLGQYDFFGVSTAIRGDNIVVGASYAETDSYPVQYNAGVAYVFSRDVGGSEAWGIFGGLHASDAQSNDTFGSALSIDGDSIVVAAPGEDGGVGDPYHGCRGCYLRRYPAKHTPLVEITQLA